MAINIRVYTLKELEAMGYGSQMAIQKKLERSNKNPVPGYRFLQLGRQWLAWKPFEGPEEIVIYTGEQPPEDGLHHLFDGENK